MNNVGQTDEGCRKHAILTIVFDVFPVQPFPASSYIRHNTMRPQMRRYGHVLPTQKAEISLPLVNSQPNLLQRHLLSPGGQAPRIRSLGRVGSPLLGHAVVAFVGGVVYTHLKGVGDFVWKDSYAPKAT